MMSKLYPTIVTIVAMLAARETSAQRLTEFNRIFKEPSENGKFAAVVSINGFGYQSSKAHGFGTTAITLHSLIGENSEFRVGGGWGGNRLSYTETDINVLKLATPKNYETYAGWVGLSQQISIGKNLFMGLNIDYAYTFKTFGRLPTAATGAHNITVGGELTILQFIPISIGANFNFINSSRASSQISNLSGKVFRTWDFYCLVEFPKWKKDSWKKNASAFCSISIGPSVIVLEDDFVRENSLPDQFIPGIALVGKFGGRFKSK